MGNDGPARSFGHAIAFLIPGFIVVLQLSPHSPTLASWLGTPASSGPTIGGFAYVAVASLVSGLIVSAIGSSVIETLHVKSGIKRPTLDYGKLQDRKDAFNIVLEHQFRYYQFYTNMCAAVFIAYLLHLWNLGRWPWNECLKTLLVIALVVLLFWASRSALSRSYERLSQVLR